MIIHRTETRKARVGVGGRIRCTLLTALALLIPGVVAAQLLPDAPAGKFRLPVFDEETGYRVWEIRGEEAQFKSEFEVEVTDMELRVFRDGVHVESTVSSPFAHIFPAARRAFGGGAIRVEAPAYTIEGEDWVWDGGGSGSSIRLNRAVRVVFHEPVDSLLR